MLGGGGGVRAEENGLTGAAGKAGGDAAAEETGEVVAVVRRRREVLVVLSRLSLDTSPLPLLRRCSERPCLVSGLPSALGRRAGCLSAQAPVLLCAGRSRPLISASSALCSLDTA